MPKFKTKSSGVLSLSLLETLPDIALIQSYSPKSTFSNFKFLLTFKKHI